MKMTIFQRMTQILLLFLVAMSLFFSYNIWFNPSGKDLTDTNTIGNQSLADTPASQIFLPTFLVFHDEEAMYWARGENVISEVQTEISKSSFGMAREYMLAKNQSINKQLRMSNGIELRYEGTISLEQYKRVFRLQIDIENKGFTRLEFNRLFINLSNGRIYFISDAKEKVVEAPIVLNFVKLNKIRMNKELSFTKVIESTGMKMMKNRYFVSEPVNLKKYSYISSTQPFVNFKDAFFDTPNDVVSKDETSSIFYTGKDNESMNIDLNNGSILYKNFLNSKISSSNRYEQSYYFVKKLGNIFPTLRYFDTTGDKVIFRTYVEGYPLFSKIDKGKVTFEFSNQEKDKAAVSIQTNIDAIQVPIPQEDMVTLPKVEDVLKELKEQGVNMDKIDQCLVGYSWNSDEIRNQVVDLSPQWFIHYESRWIPQNSLLQSAKKGDLK